MEWNSFSEKLPELGSNIVVVHKTEKMIGIAQFNLLMRRAILKDNGDYYPQDYYTDDASEDLEYDIRISDFWAYPSSVKLPNKVRNGKKI